MFAHVPVLAASEAAEIAAAPHLSATRTKTPPIVDGRIDDEAWKAATPTSIFTQRVPHDGASPTVKTTLRVLYDDDSLYVAFDCEQDPTTIVPRLTRRDRNVESDWVWIAIDSRRDGKSAFEFSVNASGVIIDALRFDDTGYTDTWDENWEARTNVDARGWTAEFRIPLRILRFDSLPVQSWGFQASRYVSSQQEIDTWTHIPRSAAGEVSHYGELDGLEGLDASTPFEVRPYVLGRLRHREPDPQILGRGWDRTLSVGLDAKWHPTQSLTVDATIHPDFAQVDADQIVLNLTTSETYYPEKRPFFLEGMDVFQTPFEILYTRRIGRIPSQPQLRSFAPFDEQAIDFIGPAEILGAAKLVGRLGERWTIGALVSLTAPNAVDARSVDGSSASRMTADPLTFQSALRLKRDLGDNAHVGLMATSTVRFDRAGDYPYAPQPDGADGRLCPTGAVVAEDARCSHDAHVFGVDGRWRSPSGDYAASGQLIASVMGPGPTRMLRDGTRVGDGDVAPGGQVRVAKEGGEHWLADATYEFDGRKLDYNDLGYMLRQDLSSLAVGVTYRTLQPFGEVRDTKTRLSFTRKTNLDGLDLGRELRLASDWRLKKFVRLTADAHYDLARFDDREVGDGTALERAGYVGTRLTLSTDPRSTISADWTLNADVLENGVNFETDGDVLFRILPQLDVDLLPQVLFSTGEPRFAAPGAAAGQYVFGRETASSVGATLRATYAFTPRLTLDAYAQLFLAAGHFAGFTQFTVGQDGNRVVRLASLVPSPPPSTNPDFTSGALNVNLVLRWEYMLGSTLFVVYTRSQNPNVVLAPGDTGALRLSTVRNAAATNALLVKLSYWWG